MAFRSDLFSWVDNMRIPATFNFRGGDFCVRPARTFSNRCKSVTRPIAGSV